MESNRHELVLLLLSMLLYAQMSGKRTEIKKCVHLKEVDRYWTSQNIANYLLNISKL